MSRVLTHLSTRFDYVLIDTPPVLPVTDAVVLSTKVDGVIVLVGTTIVRKEQLKATLESLGGVDNTLLGLVLNRVGHKSAGGYGGGYYGYYGYYDPETAPAPSGGEASAQPGGSGFQTLTRVARRARVRTGLGVRPSRRVG